MKNGMKTISVLVMCIICTTIITAQEPNNEISYKFSKDGTECIVYDDNLSRPWLNRLSNDVFFTWVTHNGYIESFFLDPEYYGLVNPQNVSGHFYLKDNNSKEYFLINESDGEGDWQAIIGLGYNRVIKKELNLKTTLTYFIPREDNVLLILVEIENTSDRNRKLSTIGQVEWNLGDKAKGEFRPSRGIGGSQHNLYKKVYVEENIMYAEQLNWKKLNTCEPWPFTGYFTTDGNIKSYETDAGKFLGYKKNWRKPKALDSGPLSNTNFWSYDEFPMGVLEKEISLAPGETKKMVFMLGMEREKKEINFMKEKYGKLENSEKALEEVKKYYKDFLSNNLTIKTPDPNNDRIINIWSQYHWRQFLKKDLNTQAFGAGFWAYGLFERLDLHPEQFLVGQDMDLLKNSLENLILINQNPDTSKNIISLKSRALLHSDEGVQWPPKKIPQGHTPIHHHEIWTNLFSMYYYFLNSGDFEYLDKELPFIDGSTGTVFEHIEKAFDITLKGLDNRGLFKIPRNVGDWMDEFTKISKDGNAESIMLSAQVAYLLKNFSEIAKKIGKDNISAKWMAEYERIKEGVNKYGWDGDWYIRAFSDRKPGFQPVGSSQNKEGKIYLNAQSWPILAGIATPNRLKKSLSSVQKYLSSKYGPLVFWPSYSKYVDYVGTQSIYSPGFRNGNIYFRPVGWAVIAAAMAGKVDLANEMYKNASISERSRDIDTYLLEPYVYPENYIGPDHQRKGEGQFHWCFGEGTGWMWYSYVGYILGVRAELDGLLIDPKIPRNWEGFKVTKPFRGATYEINVKNPDKVSSGIKWIKVDGKKLKGRLIIPHGDNRIHEVEVMMGSN